MLWIRYVYNVFYDARCCSLSYSIDHKRDLFLFKALGAALAAAWTSARLGILLRSGGRRSARSSSSHSLARSRPKSSWSRTAEVGIRGEAAKKALTGVTGRSRGEGERVVPLTADGVGCSV